MTENKKKKPTEKENTYPQSLENFLNGLNFQTMPLNV